MTDNKTVEIYNQKAQVNKSLVKVAILSSIMLFAGFSSAVLVRKMDKFWVNIQLPEDFIISTFFFTNKVFEKKRANTLTELERI